MAPELHGACFSKNSKTGFKKFQKIETKILDVYNNWIY
jgi:hypothetical protein